MLGLGLVGTIIVVILIVWLVRRVKGIVSSNL